MATLLQPFRMLAARSLVALACAALAACASTSSSQPLTPDQQVLEQYSEDYTSDFALQGAAVGAAGGAVLGCLLYAMLDQNCGTGAAIGGVAGGVAGASYGYVVGTQTAQYASEWEKTQAMSDAAQTELSAAKRSRLAAERLVAMHRQQLDSLEKRYLAGAASEDELADAIASAEDDRERMEASARRIQAQVDALNKTLGETAMSAADQKVLEAQRNQLLDEKRRLEAEASQLAGLIAAGSAVAG